MLDALTLGMGEEILEFILAVNSEVTQDVVDKERGDIMWYCVSIMNYYQMPEPKLDNNFIPLNIVTLGKNILSSFKKNLRGDFSNDERRVRLLRAVENIYLQFVSEGIHEEIMENNHKKLTSRLKNNTIKGDGDER